MCNKFLLVLNFLCIILTVWSLSDDVEVDLKEQSMLYGIALESDNITNCDRELKLFVEDVRRRKLWALNMLDSSGQEEAGYLMVNYMWMGSMSQCRNNKLYQNTTTQLLISPYEVEFMSILFNHDNKMQGQVLLPNNEYLQIGLCLPKSCSVVDISPLIDRTIAKRQLLFLQNYPVQLSLFRVKSLSDENYDWIKHPMVKYTMFLLFVTLLLTILGSYYDVCIYTPNLKEYSNENGKEFKKQSAMNEVSIRNRILLCYSFPANIRSLFNTNIKDDCLPVVHGLKFFGMFYIVTVHYILYVFISMPNITLIGRYTQLWWSQIFVKSPHSVDTFLCLSGFLFSYLFNKYHKDKKQYTLLEGLIIYANMILHRLIRLLPSYIVTIGLVVTVWRYLDTRYPLYRLGDFADDLCPKYWWRNMLFISTFYPALEMCVGWSWYLSQDIQFFVVTCALLLISRKYPKIIFVLLKILVLYSIVQAGRMAYEISYKHTLPEMLKNTEIYLSIPVRMSTYFVGVIAGYYFNIWNGRIPLSDKGYRIGWITCAITFLYVVQGLPHTTHNPQEYVSIYFGLSKFLWSSCIAWLIMACLSGQGGIINKFLSLRCWIPLSRVTFGVYLTNFIIINLLTFPTDTSTHFSPIDQVSGIFGHNALCFFVGTIFCLLFEAPFQKISKLIMSLNIKNAELKIKTKKNL